MVLFQKVSYLADFTDRPNGIDAEWKKRFPCENDFHLYSKVKLNISLLLTKCVPGIYDLNQDHPE